MLCGLHESNITPPLGTNLPGYFVFRPALGVKDELYTRAMAFANDSGSSFIIISLDTVFCDPDMAARIRARVTELCGVPGENVMVAATHTHTGGPTDGFVPGTANEEYLAWLADRAADTAVMAWNKRQPVRLGYGKAREETIAFNRRYEMADGGFKTNPGFVDDKHVNLQRASDRIVRPASVIDPEVVVVKIEDMDGKLLGVITNFACHLDTVGGNEICADFPGELSRVLKSVYGRDVVSLFLTGACGNINHYDYIGRTRAYYNEANPPHYIRMGRILAGTVIRCLADVETAPGEQEIGVAHGSFVGSVRTPSQEDLEEARAWLAEHPFKVYRSTGAGTSTGPEDVETTHFANALIAVYEQHKDNKELTIPMQVARVGKVAFAGMPCELFVEFGLDIKARSGFEYTCISTLTNSHFGYLATRESFEQGGYETKISGDTKMAPETGNDMADTTVKLMETIR